MNQTCHLSHDFSASVFRQNLDYPSSEMTEGNLQTIFETELLSKHQLESFQRIAFQEFVFF